MSGLGPCRCGHPGAGCDCYEERRAEADRRDRQSAAGGDRGDNTARYERDPVTGLIRWSAPAADRQTDEERCVICGHGPAEHQDGGEMLHDFRLDADLAARPAHADAVMADLGAAITEFGELREAVVEWMRGLFPLTRDEARKEADVVLALPEVLALLDAAAKVQRVENLRRLRAALGGER